MKNKKLTIIMVIFIILITSSYIPRVMQNDTFFAITTGNCILQNGYDNLDHLTYHENLKFYKVRWVFDVIVATIYNNFGYTGIYIFILLVSNLLALSLFYILIKQENSQILAFILTLMSLRLLSNSSFLTGRAQILSYLLLLWQMHVIYNLVRSGKKINYIYMFLISVLIVNIHATVWPMCIILLLPHIAEGIMAKFLKSGKVTFENIPLNRLFLAILMVILGSFISRIGTYTYTYYFKISGEITQWFIAEMQPTDIVRTTGCLVILIVIFSLLVMKKVKISLSDLLYMFGIFLMAVVSQRHQAFVYLLLMQPLCRILTCFFNEYDTEDLLNKGEEYFCKNKIIVVSTLLMLVIIISNIPIRLKEEYVPNTSYPVQAVKYVKENLDYANMRVFNHFNFGSYLELAGIPAFIDSRSEIFCNSFNDTTVVNDWNDVSSGKISYEDIFEKYNIDYAILYKDEIISVYIAKDVNYTKVYEDDNFCIYCKLKE